MSRIGNRKLSIPTGVEVTLEKNLLTVKSGKGSLNLTIDPLVVVTIGEGVIETKPANATPRANVMYGTTNSLIKNMLIGVSEGYTKGLEIVGVGYKFNVQGNKLTVSAGYSHPVVIEVPNGLTVTGISNTEIEVSGIDKEKVGEFAANVRKVRKPEPYKGKGIKYKGEQIRRKEGKKASK